MNRVTSVVSGFARALAGSSHLFDTSSPLLCKALTCARWLEAYFFLAEALLLELLLLPLLLELELALFFELELEPDLAGIVLSFRRAQPFNRHTVPVLARRHF